MPDSFGGTLSAVEAAAAISAGWVTGRPGDVVTPAPQSDGGPGFVDVLTAAFGGEQRVDTVTGPLGAPVRATWLLHDGTAYLESAQACGLNLAGPPTPASALAATTAGVGDLLLAALRAGARAVVVGLGGSATTDGGRGALDRLGGLDAARRLLADVDLVAATDVDNPLLGPDGAAAVFAPQKGADPRTVAILEERLTQWAARLHAETAASGPVADTQPGAGAAGGLGAALFACGARRTSGAELVAEATHRRATIADSDLVVTGEGRVDEQTGRGKLVAVVAAEARDEGTPVIVLAGQSTLTGDDVAALAGPQGQVHSLAHHVGSVQQAMDEAAAGLRDLAADIARRWTPQVGE